MSSPREAPAGLEFCDSCGGHGHQGFEEETGRPYTCYACCETGYVPAGTRAAELAAIALEQAERSPPPVSLHVAPVIVCRYRSVDGIRKARKFKTLAGARRFAFDRVGQDAELVGWEAISTDGVGVLTVGGVALELLFDRVPAAPALDASNRFHFGPHGVELDHRDDCFYEDCHP